MIIEGPEGIEQILEPHFLVCLLRKLQPEQFSEPDHISLAAGSSPSSIDLLSFYLS